MKSEIDKIIRVILCLPQLFILYGCTTRSDAIFKGYAGPIQPEKNIAIVRLGDRVDWIRVENIHIEHKKFGIIMLLPGTYSIEWGTTFGVSMFIKLSGKDERNWKETFNLKAGHIYSVHTDRTTGPGYRVFSWVIDETEKVKIWGVKKPSADKDYLHKGNQAYNKGDYETALQNYTKEIDLNPDNARAYVLRSDIWIKLDEFDNAVADTSLALELDPKYAAALFNRCSALNSKGMLDQALKDCSKGLALNPNEIEAWRLRGRIYGRRGEYDKAISDFTQAITINPRSYKALAERAFIWYRKGNYREAISDLEKAIENNPEDYNAYNNYAWILATCPEKEFRNGDKAVVMAEKSTQIKALSYNMSTLAAAFAESGNFEKAVVSQEKAIALFEKDKVSNDQLKEYYDQLKSYRGNKPWRDSL
ncbi:tetratricopeptide repeat protein [Thermodesulfobacteriota bacterium]